MNEACLLVLVELLHEHLLFLFDLEQRVVLVVQSLQFALLLRDQKLQLLLATLACLGLRVLAVALSDGLEEDAQRAVDRVSACGAARPCTPATATTEHDPSCTEARFQPQHRPLDRALISFRTLSFSTSILSDCVFRISVRAPTVLLNTPISARAE